MIKCASTTAVIELLQDLEKKHGVCSITSIGSVCSGNRTIEYVIHAKTKDGEDVSIEVPSEDESAVFSKH